MGFSNTHEREGDRKKYFPIWHRPHACPAYWITGVIGQTRAPSAEPDPAHAKLTAGSPEAEWEPSTDLRKGQVLSSQAQRPLQAPDSSLIFKGFSETLEKGWRVTVKEVLPLGNTKTGEGRFPLPQP